MKIAKTITVLFAVAALLWASGIAPQAYNLIENSTTPLTKRATLNMNGTGVSCADNAGATRTDCTINGTAIANFSQAFTAATSVTVTHNLGTLSVIVQCVDNSSPPNIIIPQNVALTSINVVTVTFSAAQSGTCVVNGSPGGSVTNLALSTRNVTSTATFAQTDYLITADTTGGGFTVSLEASPATGIIHVLKKTVAANTLTFSGNGKTIDGSASLSITTQFTSYTVQYDGTQWWIE